MGWASNDVSSNKVVAVFVEEIVVLSSFSLNGTRVDAVVDILLSFNLAVVVLGSASPAG